MKKFVGLLFRLLGKRRQVRAPRVRTDADTEYTAEVVRITRVMAHPNADRLDIVRFEMEGLGETGYEVVVRKGEYIPGEEAIYLSVDCVVPTSHPKFAFLLDRIDGRGKERFRIRAARLRGVFSQGLLVQTNGLYQFGQDVSAELGVTYHRPPEPDEGPTQPTAKPKPQPMPVYTVDSLKKMPNLFEGVPPEQIYVTEKIHGTNFRFGWVRRRILGFIPAGFRFVVGSHRVIKSGDHSTSWYKEDLWTEYAERNHLAERTRDHKGYVFYGELFGHTYGGQRIQDLTYGLHPDAGPALRMFDVRGPHGWLEPGERIDLCGRIGLVCVPQVALDITDDYSALAGGKSLLAPGQIREGVVVETVGIKPRRKAKYVSEQYLLRKETP